VDGDVTARADGDPISELARQRRDKAEREAARPRPEFIESVDRSEVFYALNAQGGIPYQLIDATSLVSSLAESYDLSLVNPDYGPLLREVGREGLSQMSQEEALQQLTGQQDSSLSFENGRFPLRDDFVIISAVDINFESIGVAVAGVSDIAEVVAQEIVELMWRIAGANKRWADLERLVIARGYSTTTRVNLGSGPEFLLNPALVEYLEAHLSGSDGFARYMGRMTSPSVGTIRAVAALDDLILKVRRFNDQTGYSDEANLAFSVMTSTDYRTGFLSCSSLMPYDKHVELLQGVFDASRR